MGNLSSSKIHVLSTIPHCLSKNWGLIPCSLSWSDFYLLIQKYLLSVCHAPGTMPGKVHSEESHGIIPADKELASNNEMLVFWERNLIVTTKYWGFCAYMPQTIFILEVMPLMLEMCGHTPSRLGCFFSIIICFIHLKVKLLGFHHKFHI